MINLAITAILADGSGMLSTILGYGHTVFSAILVLAVLIFVHELGHFLVAKKLGVGVERFSLGFGPKIIGRKFGDTEYLLSAIPLGGYVKLTGEDPDEECEKKENSFTEASVWRRLSIVSAGPAFNLLFAVMIFTVVYMVGIPTRSSVIEYVIDGSPAMKVGLISGDKIVAIDEKEIKYWDEFRKIVHQSGGKELKFKIDRGGQELTFNITPEFKKTKGMFLEDVSLGFIGIDFQPSIVGTLRSGSPAMKAGLLEGDRILEIDGKKISLWDEMREIVHQSAGKQLVFKVDRNGSEVAIHVIPEVHQTKNAFGENVEVGLIGIGAKFNPTAHIVKERYNPIIAAYKGTQKTWELSTLIVVGIKKLFQRVIPAKTIGGPILIFQMTGEQAKVGMLSLAFFVAFLSINLGILNLLPIPILDGGHILFFLVELIKGKPVTTKVREVAQQVGLAMLVTLMVFAFYNDIMRVFFN